jgi:hypothetical protein
MISIIILGILVSACTNTSKPTATPSEPTTSTSPLPTAGYNYTGWKTYSNPEYGVEFKYPADYTEPSFTGTSLLSLMSPLSPNRPSKGQNLQNDEVKVELYFGETSQGDTLEKFVIDQNGDAAKQNYEVSNEKDITVNNKKIHYRRVRGYGLNDNYFVLTKKYRIVIAKYPAETTRQSEFEQILNSFTFSD